MPDTKGLSKTMGSLATFFPLLYRESVHSAKRIIKTSTAPPGRASTSIPARIILYVSEEHKGRLSV